jgi:threonine/homoserine efflux transporter RhtA
VLWALVASVLIEFVWTIHLGPTLSSHYRAQHWRTVWVGLDVAEMVMLVATIWALWRQRSIVVVLASATGALFLADAWFDIGTDQHRDLTQSVLLAIFWEVPWAIVLFWMARRELRRSDDRSVTRRS